LAPVPEGSESESKGYCEAQSQIYTIGESNTEDGFLAEAVHSEEIYEVRWCQIEVYVLETEERRKENTADKHGGLLAGVDEGENQDAVEKAIILEMNVVNYQKCGREKDRESHSQ